jgi:hypothetical protein
MILSKADEDMVITHLYDYWWVGCRCVPLIDDLFDAEDFMDRKDDIKKKAIYLEVLWGNI